MTKNMLIRNLARREYFCAERGPAMKATSAISAKLNDGILVRRHNTCAHFTRICTQYVQIKPTMNVAIRPNTRPAFEKANGIARIPLPKLPFSRWTSVSQSLSLKNDNYKLDRIVLRLIRLTNCY